jgi:hypothetical protein
MQTNCLGSHLAVSTHDLMLRGGQLLHGSVTASERRLQQLRLQAREAPHLNTATLHTRRPAAAYWYIRMPYPGWTQPCAPHAAFARMSSLHGGRRGIWHMPDAARWCKAHTQCRCRRHYVMIVWSIPLGRGGGCGALTCSPARVFSRSNSSCRSRSCSCRPLVRARASSRRAVVSARSASMASSFARSCASAVMRRLSSLEMPACNQTAPRRATGVLIQWATAHLAYPLCPQPPYHLIGPTAQAIYLCRVVCAGFHVCECPCVCIYTSCIL